MGGGDGDHDGNDDGDDGPDDDDDLSSDEEDEEKASPDDETNFLLGLRESVKTCIKDVLIKNRKLASTLALIRLFQDVVKSVVRAMSDHHYKLATQHRTLTHLADHLNRDGDTNDTTAMDISNVEAARVEIYKQRQAAKKQLHDLRLQLQNLNAEMRSESSKTSKQTKSKETDDDDEVQALGTRGGSVTSSRNGEECLMKWIELLEQNGNTHEHHIARSIAYQCREIASDPTFRPMLSDVVPTFILPDKRKRKPTEFYKVCDETSNTADVDVNKTSKKRKSETKKESAVTKKEVKMEKKKKKQLLVR
eukprot:scaffold81748_cov63-Cyclotella_meneghiniana.AAC.3